MTKTKLDKKIEEFYTVECPCGELAVSCSLHKESHLHNFARFVADELKGKEKDILLWLIHQVLHPWYILEVEKEKRLGI